MQEFHSSLASFKENGSFKLSYTSLLPGCISLLHRAVRQYNLNYNKLEVLSLCRISIELDVRYYENNRAIEDETLVETGSVRYATECFSSNDVMSSFFQQNQSTVSPERLNKMKKGSIKKRQVIVSNIQAEVEKELLGILEYPWHKIKFKSVTILVRGETVSCLSDDQSFRAKIKNLENKRKSDQMVQFERTIVKQVINTGSLTLGHISLDPLCINKLCNAVAKRETWEVVHLIGVNIELDKGLDKGYVSSKEQKHVSTYATEVSQILDRSNGQKEPNRNRMLKDVLEKSRETEKTRAQRTLDSIQEDVENDLLSILGHQWREVSFDYVTISSKGNKEARPFNNKFQFDLVEILKSNKSLTSVSIRPLVSTQEDTFINFLLEAGCLTAVRLEFGEGFYIPHYLRDLIEVVKETKIRKLDLGDFVLNNESLEVYNTLQQTVEGKPDGSIIASVKWVKQIEAKQGNAKLSQQLPTQSSESDSEVEVMGSDSSANTKEYIPLYSLEGNDRRSVIRRRTINLFSSSTSSTKKTEEQQQRQPLIPRPPNRLMRYMRSLSQRYCCTIS